MQANQEEKKYENRATFSKESHQYLIQCVHCGAALSPEDIFCPDCGKAAKAKPLASQPLLCQKCGSPRHFEEAFCENCGTAFIAAAPKTTEKAISQHQQTSNTSEDVVKTTPNPHQTSTEEEKRKHAELLQNLKKNIGSSAEREIRKKEAEEAEKQRIIEEEKQRVADLEAKKRKIQNLESENTQTRDTLSKVKKNLEETKEEVLRKSKEIQDLKVKNLEIYRQNLDLQSRYTQIMFERDRLRQLGQKPKWKCNYCGLLHDDPSECAYPSLGGVWIY